MYHTNVIPLKDNTKNQIALTGFLMLPLRPGERACIRHGKQTISTSAVFRILEVSEDSIVFETCNSIYTLVYSMIPETEVICA